MRLLLRRNDLLDSTYVEVYAGGASVALTLLFGEYARQIIINDLDRGIHAFWLAARDQTDELCRLVHDTPLTIEEWHRQRAILRDPNANPLELAFATFYMNRTNRSGILTGGPIGGYEQGGNWNISARFSRGDLVARIQKVGRHASRIRVLGLDAAELLRTIVPTLPPRTLLYLDPPYYVKGQELLYANFYQAADHAQIAELVARLELPWVVSYDDAPEIRQLYSGSPMLEYHIGYSAHQRYRGREVMFFSDRLAVPEITDPTTLTAKQLMGLELISAR
jgi:DNA adenine methylase